MASIKAPRLPRLNSDSCSGIVERGWSPRVCGHAPERPFSTSQIALAGLTEELKGARRGRLKMWKVIAIHKKCGSILGGIHLEVGLRSSLEAGDRKILVGQEVCVGP